MLHVTTEVGVPGSIEREKKHFPSLHNVECSPEYKRTGRAYIPHGLGHQPNWRPHNEHIDPELTESDRGLDWSSKQRWIPSPGLPEENVFPEKINPLRHFPQKWHTSTKEWTAYPEGFHIGRRCKFPEEHLASKQSENEITHTMLYGKGRRVSNKRQGLATATLGDKPYQAPEYSVEFHKLGSTRPVVQFGGSRQQSLRPETFVPMLSMSTEERENYTTKEQRRQHNLEVKNVMDLDNWRPATPLAHTIPSKD